MLDLLQSRRVVLLLAGLAMCAAGIAHAESPLTMRGLAAFSSARYAEALQDWQRAAEGGDGQAALYLGLMNDLGRGVAQDADAARSWYEQAAARGNPVAMFNVGVLYDSGTGVPRDRTLAADWYRRAADRGMGRAAYALGLMYKSGDGVPADRDQAVRYFRQALASGVPAARPHLAALGASSGAQTGEKTRASDSSAETGLAEFDHAQDLLMQRTPQASEAAAALLRQTANKGDLLAAYNLAYCYENGIGLEVDRRQAYVWYGRAARSPTATVRRAALAGMEAITRKLNAAELAAAKASLAAFGPAQ